MNRDSQSLNLNGLALETLQQVAGHLHETHRPSLYAFSLASQKCHRATLPEVFREIHLRVCSRQALQRDVGALIEILSRTDSARHVRYLSIKGSLRLDAEGSDDSGAEAGTSADEDTHLKYYKSTGMDDILPEEEPICDGSHVCHDQPVIAKSSEEDMAWAPVVSLVKILSRVNTLVYDCRNQFPPSLLDALHEHQPQCKLHHLTFRMRSLLSDVPDPYEMTLATSPCLYRVKVACAERDSVGAFDYNEEAIMELVAGLAPNLKEVVVVGLYPMLSWRFSEIRPTWRSLPGFVPGAGIGSLTSLSLVSHVKWSPDLLRSWAKHTDFGNLRHLALGGGYKLEHNVGMDDEMMEWIAQNCSFPRLKTLDIRIERNDMWVEKPNYADNAIALFKSFEPLEQLSVAGPLEPKILDAILSRHGPTLRKLSLRSTESPYDMSNSRHRTDVPMVFQKEHVLQIQAQCPALQELTIPVKRRKSDAFEAEVYKTFGKMERLRSLFLVLDCSEWRVYRDSTYNPFNGDDCDSRKVKCASDDRLKEGHLREAFINCAVDEMLARSIWDTICRHKVGTQLGSLKLWTTGGGRFGDSSCLVSDEVYGHLSRSWLIERVVGDVVDIRELGRRAREMRDEKMTKQSRWASSWDSDRSFNLGVIGRIWPRKVGSEDWREDWFSFPLHV